MSLILTHVPGEWDGTFENTLEVLLKDLLSDGEIEIDITTELGLQRRITLCQCTGGEIFSADGGQLSLRDVVGVRVP